MNNNNMNMKPIIFIPKEFHDIKLGYFERSQNFIATLYPLGIPINTIVVSTPQKIIYHVNHEDFVPVIPVCAEHMITTRRGLKYAHLSARMLHIRRLDEETVYSGEIVNKPAQFYIDDGTLITVYTTPAIDPRHGERERERQARIAAAQKYSDEELDEGLTGLFRGNLINVNLMEYVDFPFRPGI